MKFGLFGGAQAHPGEHVTEASLGYHEYGDYVAQAERLGYASVWLVEHHFTGFGQLTASLNYLSYLAARTSTMRLGTAVVVVPWHNPVLLAEEAATVDVISRGRLDLGVGRGYRYTEFHGFGIDEEEARSIFTEAMEVVRKGWTERDRWSYKSDRWEFNDVIIEPPPVQQPHPPLWLAAANPDSVERAAREGYNLLLNQLSDFETIGESIRIYREAIEALGKPYDPMSVGVTRGLMVANSDRERAEAHTVRNRFMTEAQVLSRDPKRQEKSFGPIGFTDPREVSERGAVVGGSEEMIERVAKLREVGAEYLLFHDLTSSPEGLQQFAEEVMPHFRDKDQHVEAAV